MFKEGIEMSSSKIKQITMLSKNNDQERLDKINAARRQQAIQETDKLRTSPAIQGIITRYWNFASLPEDKQAQILGPAGSETRIFWILLRDFCEHFLLNSGLKIDLSTIPNQEVKYDPKTMIAYGPIPNGSMAHVIEPPLKLVWKDVEGQLRFEPHQHHRMSVQSKPMNITFNPTVPVSSSQT